MTDFIDGLEHDLVDAARRHGRARRTAAGVRRGRATRRGIALALGALVLAGSATAAVVRLTSPQPSKPLAGPLHGAAPSARAYAVSLLPDLRAGQAGWCSVVRISSGAQLMSTGMGCGPARAAGGTQIVAGGSYGPDGGLAYAVVTSRVRAVRFDARTLVTTRSDPALPYGWRYAIATVRTPTAPRPDGIAVPGHTPTTPPQRSTAARPAGMIEPPMPVQLDAHGKALPATTRADDVARGARSRPVTASHPAKRCAIGRADGFTARYARVALGRPRTARRLAGRAFASCAQTIFRTRDERGAITAAILLDARDPAARAASLPRTPDLDAKRLGPGWLAVYGGSAAGRQRLLARLHPRL